MTRQTQTQKAQGAVEDARRRLSELEAEQTATHQKLTALQERAGEDLLDDPAAARRITAEIRDLRDRSELLGRAVEAQRPRVRAAEVAFLNVEADRLDKIADRERSALAAHGERTSELLAMLEEHEGRFVPEHLLIEEQRRDSAVTVVGAPTSWKRPKSGQLEDQVEAAELPVRILRDLAEDRQPVLPSGVAPAEVYPACVWGPKAVVPAPAYQRIVETRTEQLRELQDSKVPAAREKVAALEAELAEAEQQGDVRQLKPSAGPAGLSGGTVADRMATAKKKLENLLTEERELAGELTALTGEPMGRETNAVEQQAS